jgi:hypothetical protein
MSANVDTTVTVWQYPFPFLYLLLRIHICRFHGGPLLLDNKSVYENIANLIQAQANRHYAKCQPKDSRSYS